MTNSLGGTVVVITVGANIGGIVEAVTVSANRQKCAGCEQSSGWIVVPVTVGARVWRRTSICHGLRGLSELPPVSQFFLKLEVGNEIRPYHKNRRRHALPTNCQAVQPYIHVLEHVSKETVFF